MRKLFSIAVLLVFLTLPALAQLTLFPTPAKVSGGKGSFLRSVRHPRSPEMADMPINWLKNYRPN